MHTKILWSAETCCTIGRETASEILLARILRRIPIRVSIDRALFHSKPRTNRLDLSGRKRSHPIPRLLGGVLVYRLPQHELPDADPHPHSFALQTLLDPHSSKRSLIPPHNVQFHRYFRRLCPCQFKIKICR